MFGRLKIASAALALMAGVAISSAASAQTFTFQGTTGGCFYSGASACTPTSSDTLGGLSFTGSSFSGKTAGGELTLGSAFNNLGTFVLTGQTFNYNGSSFVLGVTFTMPSGTSPSGTTFNAMLTGQVANTTDGGVKIDFDNLPKSFVFTGGSFSLAVFDVGAFPNAGPSYVGGQIIATPGPIAGAGIPALLGLAGLMFYRRRKQTNA